MDEKERLFLMRRKKGITLTEISKNIKTSTSLLSKFENGKSNLSEFKFNAYKNYILGRAGEKVKEGL